MVAAPESVAKAGAAEEFARSNCPEVPADVAETAEEPLPYKTPLAVKLVAPVPPEATVKVPVVPDPRSVVADPQTGTPVESDFKT